MKKITITFFLLSAVLSSCSKKEESATDPELKKPAATETKLHQIKFRATGFQQTHEKFTKVASTSPTPTPPLLVKQLDFSLISQDGQKILLNNAEMINIQQTPKTPDFGRLNIALPKGKYILYVFGYNAGKLVRFTANGHSFNYIDHKAVNNSQKKISIYPQFETFAYSTGVFSVNGDSTYAPLILERINSRLIVEVEDLPAAATEMRVLADQSTRLDYIEPKDSRSSKPIRGYVVSTPIADKLFSFDLYAPSNIEQEIELSIYDATGTILAKRTVEKVVFKENTVTKLKGKLLNQQGDAGFEVITFQDFPADTLRVSF